MHTEIEEDRTGVRKLSVNCAARQNLSNNNYTNVMKETFVYEKKCARLNINTY